ncbi:MAG: response regulator [Cyclobacteriaceae bacterium]
MKRLTAIFIFLQLACNSGAYSQNIDSIRQVIGGFESQDSVQAQSFFLNTVKASSSSKSPEIHLIWAEYLNDNRKYDSAEMLFQKSIELYQAEGDKSGLAHAKLKLGDFYENSDNVSASLILNHEAYDLFVELQDSTNIYFALASIGINHDYRGDHEIAIQYYEECIELAKSIGRDISVAAMYHNLGGIYSFENEFEKALDYYEKSKNIATTLNDISLLTSIYQGLYLAYRDAELFSEAFVNLKKQLQYAKLSDSQKAMAFAYQDYGTYFLVTKKYDSSIYYSTQALELALKLNNAQIVTNAYQGLRKAYYELGDYKKAFDFYANEIAMNDSLYNIENSRLIETTKAKFETEKKERELAEKNLALQTADFNLKRQNTYMILLIIGIVSILIIVFLVYRGYMLRKKANDVLRKKNAEIESQNEKIKSSNEVKSRWFINVAHELRTPLTLIKGPVQRILSTEKLSLDVEENLEMVYQNTQSLVKLVNEILDLSKLEEGEMLLSKQVVNFNDLVRQIISIYEIKSRQQRVKIDWEDMSHPYMEIDPEKVSKILVNLISNALRFTDPGGSISIYAKIENEIKICVKDTGVGIEPKDLPHVFDRFYQANTSKNAGGTGVGLALSKEIAQLHGGDLEVESTFQQGSIFTLSLPKSLTADAPQFEESAIEIGESLEDNFVSTNILTRLSEKPLLLIVEDNPDMRKYLSGLLKPYFEIKEASNGLEGLKVLESENIKMIISDMMMPGMDGLQFSQRVKAHAEWKTIPFIYLSAMSEDIKRKEALMLGVDDYLQKPFDPEELIIRVRNLFTNAMSRMEVTLENSEPVSYEDKTLKKLKNEVEENISDPNFSVARLADSVAMSERSIYRYLKAITGLTPLQFIQEIRLSKAMELAQNRVYLSSSELAVAMGFKNSPYFSSLFEKRFGRKPSAYLKVG